jgi:hypothetical protein
VIVAQISGSSGEFGFRTHLSARASAAPAVAANDRETRRSTPPPGVEQPSRFAESRPRFARRDLSVFRERIEAVDVKHTHPRIAILFDPVTRFWTPLDSPLRRGSHFRSPHVDAAAVHEQRKRLVVQERD